jgi:hypothetical protein
MVLPIDQHDALRMLAGSPGGCTESILLAHGFGIGTVHDLVDSGFATAERRTVRAERRLWGDVADDYRRRAAGAHRVGGAGWLRGRSVAPPRNGAPAIRGRLASPAWETCSPPIHMEKKCRSRLAKGVPSKDGVRARGAHNDTHS